MVSHEDTKDTKGKVIPYIFLVVFVSSWAATLCRGMNEPLRGFPAMVSHEDTKYTKGKVIPYIFLVVFASLCLCGRQLCVAV